MAQYKVIGDLFTNLVELKEEPLFGNCHEVELETTGPTLNDQTINTYEEEDIGTVIGRADSSTFVGVTFEILDGNTGNAFTINSSTGYITTAMVLDYETLSAYTLTVKVTLNSFSNLTDTSTVTINVLKMYHICEDYGVSESGTSLNNQLNYLAYNEIQLSTGTLGDYLINWNLNSITGETVFVSGNVGNTDTDLQAEHPFYDLCQAGTIYPVFRYITVNSVKYSGVRLSEDGLYSEDLSTCLAAKTVTAMSCSNGTTGGTYGHTITYTNTTMPSGAAERTLTYLLNEDGSSENIAWFFNGDAIADRITISYVSGTNETVIDDWVIGSDSAVNNFTSTPKVLDQIQIGTAFSLTGFTYTDGDYLKFHISPSYNDPTNTDTNWQLSIKCFIDTVPIDMSFASGDICVIGDTGTTLNLTYNETNCTYDLAVHTISGITSSVNDITKYFKPAYYMTSSDFDTDTVYSLNAYTGTTYSWSTGGLEYPLDGQMTIEKNGTNHTLKYTFTNENDYLIYKSKYYTFTGTTHFNLYSTDTTNPYHNYRYYLQQKVSLTSGDTYSIVYYYFEHESSFNFDDTNHIITINLAPHVFGYVGGECNTYEETARSGVTTLINNFYSGDTTSYTTIWGSTYPWRGEYYLPIASNETNKVFGPSYYLPYAGIVHESLPLGPRFVITTAARFYKLYLRVIITNESDPTNNYEVYNYLNSDGSTSATGTLIKKVGT